jgi:hypothetical protein
MRTAKPRSATSEVTATAMAATASGHAGVSSEN